MTRIEDAEGNIHRDHLPLAFIAKKSFLNKINSEKEFTQHPTENRNLIVDSRFDIESVVDRTDFLDPRTAHVLCFLFGELPLILLDRYSAELLTQTCHSRPTIFLGTAEWI